MVRHFRILTAWLSFEDPKLEPELRDLYRR